MRYLAPVADVPAAPSPRGLGRELIRMIAVAAVLGSMFGLAPLALEPAQAADTTHVVVSARAFGGSQKLAIDLNKSVIVDLPADVAEVIVSRPEVAGAILRSKRRAIVQSASPGDTNIFLLDARGRTITVLDISVGQAVSTVAQALRETYARVLPNSRIAVESVSLDGGSGNANRIVLSGTAANSDDVAKALAIAGQFAGSMDNVASLLTVDGPQQVMLKVTVAEVKRDVANQLGINLSSTFSIGGVSGALSSSFSGNLANGLSLGSGSIDVAIRALASRGAVRMLAEPVLTAVSGQPAKFFAGGEFRYATGTDDKNQPVYAYKDYGVSLNFTPTIKSSGTIGLVVDTTVSEPQSDTTINRRNVSTTVELSAGQTLSIAGLFDERARQSISRLPGLGDIPILGALFRSRDYSSNRTELVFLVTPYLAKAGPAPALPTDAMAMSNDAEAIFLGKIERLYGVGSQGMRGSYKGSVGFVLD